MSVNPERATLLSMLVESIEHCGAVQLQLSNRVAQVEERLSKCEAANLDDAMMVAKDRLDDLERRLYKCELVDVENNRRLDEIVGDLEHPRVHLRSPGVSGAQGTCQDQPVALTPHVAGGGENEELSGENPAVTPQQSDMYISKVPEDSVAQVEQNASIMASWSQLLYEDRCDYKLAESIWDASLFIGTRPLGFESSCFVAELLFMNVLMKGGFCLLCIVAFAQGDFSESDIFALHVWRLNSGHHVSNVGDVWPLSLASRVCEGDTSLPISRAQADQYDDLSQYLKGGYMGELGCVISLLCFWISLWEELRGTFMFSKGVVHLCGSHTQVTYLEGGLLFDSIGAGRSAFLLVIVVMRLSVVGLLGYAGTVWLAYTTTPGDFLLNALALDLVKSVDEMLFQAFAPIRLRELVSIAKPLPMRNLFGINRIGCILLAAAIPVAHILITSHTEVLVHRAKSTLCSGITNFVYNVDPLGVVYIHDGMKEPSDVEFTRAGFDQTDLRVMAASDVIQGTRRDQWQHAIFEPDIDELRRKSTIPPSMLIDEINPHCRDLLADGNANVRPVLGALRHAAGDRTIDTCENVVPYCTMQSGSLKNAGLLARALCPVTCCISPTSGTFVLIDVYRGACPTACLEIFQGDAHKAETCEDQNVRGSHMWVSWMKEVKELSLTERKHVKALEQEGCPALLRIPESQQFCTGGWDFSRTSKPLVHFCPVSCGCFQENGECPECREPCTCMNFWSALDSGKACEAQSGCPTAACDGDARPWCIVSNPPCAVQEDDTDGTTWAYCD